MKVALVQIGSPSTESKSERIQRAEDMLHDIPSADLIVFPELWAPGYFYFDRYEENAEPLEGPVLGHARRWAKRLSAHVHVGSIIETRDGQLYNTAILLDPSGDVVQVYRKIHVFGYQSREAQLLTAGEMVTTTGTPFGRLSSTTCYDLRFPAVWEALVKEGTDMAIVPAAWPAARLHHWQLFTSVRAVENQIYVIACNAVGEQEGISLPGHSRVVDPWGDVLFEAGDEEGIYMCEVNPALVEQVRREFPVLADRQKVGTGTSAIAEWSV
ncbi:carbon-nitrogen family hydrolase [Ornithinimicrobium cryptoxanthini]|uniref:Carbon-nitrogen family hydrolase n=1 Tax=Ornithinimicrobium cryptoxanthini TaxID=2934161 RepID=A0ABY4YNI0_9MICO|nr:carbon-nitrogen family hydrolase [Ornithinimicrobium cryptoxanthini]USQ77810.1 carbon-nitrogen family hydrolase [Ornithinimicrobium cryptoxanthini]